MAKKTKLTVVEDLRKDGDADPEGTAKLNHPELFQEDEAKFDPIESQSFVSPDSLPKPQNLTEAIAQAEMTGVGNPVEHARKSWPHLFGGKYNPPSKGEITSAAAIIE